ncbi:MAG: adenylate/guanylate cyclase domain-containing protein [Limibacillus sp.]|jgi:adenylate cyclase
MQRRLAAILAADVVGYSRLMERDTPGTLDRLGRLRREIFTPGMEAEGGRIVKLTGDGALVEFTSIISAIKAALSVQEKLADSEAACGNADPLCLRIGINLGEIIESDGDIYGDGVNVAARLEQIAEPAGICISASAYDQVRGEIDAPFEDLGPQQVKNISRPIGVYSWRRRGLDPLERLAGQEAGKSDLKKAGGSLPSIAVLPLTNMSKDDDLEFLADGLTEDIITLLARMPGFLVIARNSSFAYKGKSPDAREVGKTLGVRYMVEGSIRQAGKRLRVTVQLIDTGDGRHLWAERFDCDAGAAMEIQDEITQKIAARLEPALARAEVQQIQRSPAANRDAWALYREANGLLSLRGWHRETFEEGSRLLNKAIEIEPDFALAHAYLSLLTALGHLFDLNPEGENAEETAVEAAERAMTIDAYNSVVLGYAGCALADLGHVARGIGILERAVEEDPSNAQAWVALGVAQIRGGKARKGVELLRHGMRLSPLDNRLAYWGTNLAYALFRLHKKEEALEEARLACRRDDKNYMARVVLALIAADAGRDAEAREAIADAKRIRPDIRGSEMAQLLGRKGVRLLDEKGLLAA